MKKPMKKRKPLRGKKISEEVGETTSLPDRKKCPECGGLWEYFIRGERFSHVVGIEDPNVYDGVSWWRCPHCGATWDRWTGKLMKDWPKKPRKRLDKLISQGKVRRGKKGGYFADDGTNSITS